MSQCFCSKMQIQNANKKIRLIMQLRSAGIVDMDVLGAIEGVPREEFIPDELVSRAWENTALPIGLGQTISQPLVVAKMTSALCLSDRDKVLEIGTGCGYQSAILARLARRIYTIERHKPLAQSAQKRLDRLGIRNITAICADGMKGWKVQAPFDKIIITAAAKVKPPEELLDQLKEGGILIAPVGESGNQMLKSYTKELGGHAFAQKDIMPVRFVPLLPDVA